MRIAHKGLIAAGLAALAGCSSGASSELKPGMYEMKLGGGFAGITMPGLMPPPSAMPERICLDGDPQHYPARLLRPYMKLHDACGEAEIERDGDRLTGVAVCPLDSGRALGGSVTMLLNADVTSAGVEGEVSTKWDLGQIKDPELTGAVKLMESTTLRISANYLGPCDQTSAPPPSQKVRPRPMRDETDAQDTTAPDTSAVDTPVETAQDAAETAAAE